MNDLEVRRVRPEREGVDVVVEREVVGGGERGEVRTSEGWSGVDIETETFRIS